MNLKKWWWATSERAKKNNNNKTNKQKANVIEIKIKPTEHVAQKQIV